MTRTETLYICPDCGRESTHKQTRVETPKGTPKEYHCICGMVYTQETARKATFKDRT
jgi:hypothetical protein